MQFGYQKLDREEVLPKQAKHQVLPLTKNNQKLYLWRFKELQYFRVALSQYRRLEVGVGSSLRKKLNKLYQFDIKPMGELKAMS
jgi:hypothetical protein